MPDVFFQAAGVKCFCFFVLVTESYY